MRNKAFTVIELLVAFMIFSLVIGSSISAFLLIVRHQRKVLLKQEIINQTSYATEFMSRALRMAKKDDLGECLSQGGLNYENTDEEAFRIRFINHLQDDECQEFFLENGQLKHKRKISSGQETLDLTSDKFQISSLEFNILGESEQDNLQPRVTFLLEIKAKGAGDQPGLKVQTTISQRNLDI